MISVTIRDGSNRYEEVLPGAPRVNDEIRLRDGRLMVVSTVFWDCRYSTLIILVKEWR